MLGICVAFVAAAAARRAKGLLQKGKTCPDPLKLPPPADAEGRLMLAADPWRSTRRRMKQWSPTRLRYLGDHLLDDGLAERVEVFRHQDKGAGTADDIVAVIVVEAARWIGVVGIPYQRGLAEDDKTVDGDALGKGFVARQRHVAASIVGAVARDVDGAASGFIGRARELPHGELDCAADRRAIRERSRRLQQAVAKTLRRFGIADGRPVDEHPLRADARPLDERQSDTAVAARPNGIEDARIGDGGRIALALQLEFGAVGAARDVGR